MGCLVYSLWIDIRAKGYSKYIGCQWNGFSIDTCYKDWQLKLSPRTHVVEGEDWVFQVVQKVGK